MTFPNAAKGVKKLYTAEILGLIGMIITIVGLIAVVIGTAVTVAGAAAEQGSVAVGGLIGTGVGTIFSGAAAILTLIGFILQLVGYSQAGKDEGSFKTALIVVLVGVAATVVLGVLSGIKPQWTVLTEITQIVNQAVGIIALCYAITGIRTLAEQLGNEAVANRGKTLLNAIIIVLCLSIVANFIGLFVHNVAGGIVAGVLALVAAVISLVRYFLYLGYLAKAKKMLEEN